MWVPKDAWIGVTTAQLEKRKNESVMSFDDFCLVSKSDQAIPMWCPGMGLTQLGFIARSSGIWGLRAGYQHGQVPLRILYWVVDGCLLVLLSLSGKEAREMSGTHFIRPLIPFMKASLSPAKAPQHCHLGSEGSKKYIWEEKIDYSILVQHARVHLGLRLFFSLALCLSPSLSIYLCAWEHECVSICVVEVGVGASIYIFIFIQLFVNKWLIWWNPIQTLHLES